VYFNATRINGIDGTNAKDLTFAEMDGRAQASSLLEFVRKHVPAFRKCWLIATGSQLGVRETRRIAGEYTLTYEDLAEGKQFADGVATGAYPVDIHEVTSEWGAGEQKESLWVDLSNPHDIPLGSLIPKGATNVLVAGRCISCTHEALGAIRVQPTSMAMGQAAGAAAAQLIQKGLSSTQEVNCEELRQQLDQQGAYIRGIERHKP